MRELSYFVSIENNYYFHWQVELLIQSFQYYGLQDNLHIAIAETEEPVFQENTRLLSKHQNCFFHENYGRSHKCPKLNQIYSLYSALKSGSLKQPFVLIHPDMVLAEPMMLPEEYRFVSVSFGEWIPQDQEELHPYIQRIADDKGIVGCFPYMMMGDVMLFEKMPLDFFERTCHRSNVLNQELGPKFDIIKGAFALSIFEYLGNCAAKVEMFESHLLSFELHNFIHYKHGLPPDFHKKYFKGEMVLSSTKTPHQVLLENNPTLATNFLQKTVKDYEENIN